MQNFLFVFAGWGVQQKIVGQSLMSHMTLFACDFVFVSLPFIYELCTGYFSSLTKVWLLLLPLLLWRLKSLPNTQIQRIKKALTMWAGANYLAIKLVVPADNFVCIFYGFSNAAKLFFTTRI